MSRFEERLEQLRSARNELAACTGADSGYLFEEAMSTHDTALF